MTLTQRPKVCILVFSTIARDGRVLRQVEAARSVYDVDVIAHGPWAAPEHVRYFEIPRSTAASIIADVQRLLRLAAGRWSPAVFERIYWQQKEYRQALELLQGRRYDLIHANDWTALPAASRAAQGTNTRLLYDAHEYTPAQFDQYFTGRHLKSRYYEYLLRTYSRNVHGMVTVSDGIATLYRQNFGWEAVVVRNAPAYTAVDFHPTHPSSIQLVHHGGAIPERRLEDLIWLTALLDDRFCLTFMLVPSSARYLAQLKKLADRIAPGRIRFVDAVPPEDLASQLSAYDMGIHLLKAVNLNHLYALPNKLFEFIMAGLGVAIFPVPEMARVVEGHQIGLVSPEQSLRSMAEALNRLSVDQIDQFKRNSLSLAKTLNGDVEMSKLMNIYAELLSS